MILTQENEKNKPQNELGTKFENRYNLIVRYDPNVRTGS